MLFRKKSEKWVKVGKIFSEKKLENIQNFMMENGIPYKYKPDIHFGMVNNLGQTNVISAWCVYVREGDVHRIRKYIATGYDL